MTTVAEVLNVRGMKGFATANTHCGDRVGVEPWLLGNGFAIANTHRHFRGVGLECCRKSASQDCFRKSVAFS